MADDPDLQKLDVTNNDQGTRFLWADGGTGTQVFLKPGETKTVSLSEGQFKAAEAMLVADTEDDRVFSFDNAGEGGDNKPLAKHPISELRQIAEAEGVALTGRKDGDGKDLPDLKTAKDIAAAIEAKRATA
jgi:hypothetical protein